MSKQKISPTGAWLFQGGHMFDARLAEAIRGAFIDADVKTVVDMGCGDGTYTRFLKDCYFDVVGYDGNPDTEQITGGLCKVMDFGKRQFHYPYDAVLCLEVGEHIPAKDADVFLANVTDFATKLIILSWAVPGQGGHGHINEQPNSWVIDEMDERGWTYDQSASDHLRANASNCYWFKNTVMVFRPS